MEEEEEVEEEEKEVEPEEEEEEELLRGKFLPYLNKFLGCN